MISRSKSSATIQNTMSISTDSNEKGGPYLASPKSAGFSRFNKIFIGIFLAGFFLTSIVIFQGPPALKEHRRDPNNSYERLTIVMNTFKRPEELKQAVDYYSQCELVKYIYIVWSEKEPPSEGTIKKYAARKHPTTSFLIQEKDSLNNRFKPLDVPHFDAILSVDDDMRIPCEDLHVAYEVWRGSPRSLVGWMPRIHLRQSDGTLVYRCWWRVWWHGLYSIILTKAAIMHHDFFTLYTNEMPQSVRDLVDKRRNCEDIAMQFMIANVTQLPPIYVKGHLGDLGALGGGISTNKSIVKAKHMGERSECLNELEAIFHGVPLVSSHIIVDSASNGWTNVPSTVWEYISSDLWKFSFW